MHIHEGLLMRVLLRCVTETLANTLNSQMCATGKSSPIAASAHRVDNRSCKLLQSYSEVVKFLLNKICDQRMQNWMTPIYFTCILPAYYLRSTQMVKLLNCAR